ncbi:glutathione S-transferase family protein [Tianweitania sp. BSSL-BM11]|uniref:Glutathione S-transferase family protein n=1 Tax=Tianweitania aestuarii TaxID=2814886 RepID=A0ABS5RSH7_9HYPH|nr:glutathione S-transferase family protein [Tianweitania aestuarii]
MSIKLYDLVGKDHSRPFSPHCWKVRMALAHKNLSYETVPTSFTEVRAVEGGASKIIPVIRDGETVVSDSFAIALYLEHTYPDRPTLFGGQGGESMARFIERWSLATIHPFIGSAVLMDIHECLEPVDQAHFRKTREARFNKPLEEVPVGRDEKLEAFRASLAPLRSTLAEQPFIGGVTPLFCDYIVFGALQWARVVSTYGFLASDDPVAVWFERCLALHEGIGASVPAAA